MDFSTDFDETINEKTADIEGSIDVGLRFKNMKINDEFDARFGYVTYKEPSVKIAWLLNMHPTEIFDEEKRLISAVNYYFIEDDGCRFKISLPFQPYFYVAAKIGYEKEISLYLSKKYSSVIESVQMVDKEDLDLPNHLIGLKRTYLKINFLNVNNLLKVRRELMPRIRKNREKEKSSSDYTDMLINHLGGEKLTENVKKFTDQLENIVDIREYDVPYHIRVSIDLKIFVGHWYNVCGRNVNRVPEIIKNPDVIDRPDPIVLAFDIETTKQPLKFPDPQFDQIMMISYMIDAQGYLIVNREIVSSDVEDFEYTPRPEYEGPFQVFNELNEYHVLVRFFQHVRDVRPHIFVTYNGDFFDWPFIETRAATYGLQLRKEIGFEKDSQDEYKSPQCIHMDAFKWVKRDSYLPMGSQGLKACTKAKLRYDPVELDPELMCDMAKDQPRVLANYSVSDAVATYYLYMKYVHPFIFALCTIIPMEPDEVLRKGSGTLCEALLMVEAFHCNIIFPNKQETDPRKMTDDGHLIESETYVGGHVEALESGIFRADIPCRFRLIPSAFDDLMADLERTMQYAVEIEDVQLGDLTDFTQKCDEIRRSLVKLRDCPTRLENPLIYHLDVAAMYPNIILTNRLQPPAIINETACAACDFNRPGAKCQRKMNWMSRSEIVPANRSEYQRIVQQLENEKFPSQFPNGTTRAFHQLPKEDQIKIEKKRLIDYCRRAYRRVHETKTELCETMICQRENSFYVDTVKAFRDRRYEYKNLLKNAKKKLDAATKGGDAAEIKSCKSKEILYDSLQLAHKCILNSFYGYVMRKGSRWFSMEMAGIVCYTGAQIIMKSKELVEKIGRPLELDTDGIWCALPGSFPENVTFTSSNTKRPFITVSYPGAVLNIMVRDAYTNDQYHTLVDLEHHKYKIHSENSIAFEVDGPYKAMVLPAAKEEGKKLKKRYAVFNFDGSLAELKGFEVKRRGELQLIKNFQSSVFDAFLNGAVLDEVYQSVAKVADYWLDVLYSRAVDMPDTELFELLSENRSLSKKLEDYGAQKSTSITVAKRLAEFLGDQMVKDAGLACKIIIAKEPVDYPVTERAIPMIIFQAEGSVRRHYLRKWLKNSNLASYDIRDILDWTYYIERLGSAIQKIITIPAALQGVPNPVPRVTHPDWLHKRLLDKNDVLKQKRITECFRPVEKIAQAQLADLEDLGGSTSRVTRPTATVVNRKRTSSGGNKNSKTVETFERHWREILGKPQPYGSSTESRQVWLSFMKKKWTYQKKQRDDRKIQKRPTPFTDLRRSATVGIDGFVQKSVRALSEMPWQILQLAKTNEPGLFNVWIMVGNDLRSIKIRVPRIFYINLKIAKENETTAVYKKVHRMLPRSNPVYFLYQYQVPEDQFQQNVNDMTAELSAPEVDGIYETQVPLLFRVFVDLGCVCRLTKENRKAYLETDVFDFGQLEFLSLSQSDYLEENNFRQLFFYHYSQDARAIWALFNMTSKKVEIWFLDKSRNANIPNLHNLYAAERNAKLGKLDENLLPEPDYQFQVNSFSNIKDIYRLIQRSVRSYKDEKRGSTFFSFISSFETEILTNSLPILNDFPMIKLRIAQPENMFGALDWQRVGCRSAIVQFLNFPTYFQNYLELCRYLHMPLGNVPKDFAAFGADLFFARYLQRQNHILWCSPSDRPDFGGKEVDDNRLVSDFFESQDLNLNQPGFYTSCCVELDVASLPIAALLQSQKISEEEGVSAAVGFDVGQQQVGIDEMINSQRGLKILAGYDEAAFCAHSFRFLKAVVHGWVKDLANFSNKFADNLIVHFYRWLRSSTSYMYEPALKKIINALMKKLFLLLVADLKRLGAVIVHATLSKIIICTKKRNDADATTYVNFILSTINKKDLFSPLDITVRQTWRVLLWLDPANYGGIKVDSCESSNADVSTIEEEIVDMNWNLMHFLPVVGECQTNFDEFVAGYIFIVYKQVKKELENVADREHNATVSSSLNDSQSSGGNATQTIVGNEKINENLIKFCQNLIAAELTPKLARFVQKLQRKIMVTAGDVGVAEMFPNLPGSYLKLTNPALEFAKSVCKVISLDVNVDDEAENMRRTVLQCVGVGEFSSEAEWHDPCLSYVLPEVICKHCNHCRDVDLCRDSYIFEKEKELSRWRCNRCDKEYNLNEIEQILIHHLNKWMMSYCLQDLKCDKCRMVKQAHMNSHCECSGNFSQTVSSENLMKTFRAFANLARCYRLVQLQESLRFLAALCPQLKIFM